MLRERHGRHVICCRMLFATLSTALETLSLPPPHGSARVSLVGDLFAVRPLRSRGRRVLFFCVLRCLHVCVGKQAAVIERTPPVTQNGLRGYPCPSNATVQLDPASPSPPLATALTPRRPRRRQPEREQQRPRIQVRESTNSRKEDKNRSRSSRSSSSSST